jgi:hypothetical protein
MVTTTLELQYDKSYTVLQAMSLTHTPSQTYSMIQSDSMPITCTSDEIPDIHIYHDSALLSTRTNARDNTERAHLKAVGAVVLNAAQQ